MTKPQRVQRAEEQSTRSGRRRNSRIDAPRDQTVCLLVSEDEKKAIDGLAATLNRTRSAMLARLVVAFVEDASEDGRPVRTAELLAEFHKGEWKRKDEK